MKIVIFLVDIEVPYLPFLHAFDDIGQHLNIFYGGNYSGYA